MNLSNYLKQPLAFALILAISSYSITTPAVADIVPTSELLAQQQQESTRVEVNSLLQEQKVANMLTEMGVDVEATQERIDSLTVEELELLSEKMNELPAGEGALGTIALVLVILILLDVAGVTDIFPAV